MPYAELTGEEKTPIWIVGAIMLIAALALLGGVCALGVWLWGAVL